MAAGNMVDGRLVAATRALYEQARSSGSSGSGVGSQLGSSWERHLRVAVGRRCQELLSGLPTPLVQDLERLAEWEQQTGQEEHGWAAALAHYEKAVEAHEVHHGSVQQDVQQSPGATAAAAEEGSDSSSSSSNPPGLIDAGAAAAENAELAQLLLQQLSPASASSVAEGRSGAVGAASILPVAYRVYKKIVLWDAILLAAE
jgi:hypothetical protein